MDTPVKPSPQWQPIETAPTDGTKVLLWQPTGNLNRIVGHKVGFSWSSIPGGYGVHPTQWQPLPDPPCVPSPQEQEKPNATTTETDSGTCICGHVRGLHTETGVCAGARVFLGNNGVFGCVCGRFTARPSNIEIRSALGLMTHLDTLERLQSIQENTDAWPHLLASQQWAIIDAIDELSGGNQATTEVSAAAMGALRNKTDAQPADPSTLPVVPRAPQEQEPVSATIDHTTVDQATSCRSPLWQAILAWKDHDGSADVVDREIRQLMRSRAPQDQQEEKEIQDHTRLVEPQPGSRTADPRVEDRGWSIQERKNRILDAVQRYGATPDTSPDVVERLAEVDVAIDELIELAIPECAETEPRLKCAIEPCLNVPAEDFVLCSKHLHARAELYARSDTASAKDLAELSREMQRLGIQKKATVACPICLGWRGYPQEVRDHMRFAHGKESV